MHITYNLHINKTQTYMINSRKDITVLLKYKLNKSLFFLFIKYQYLLRMQYK